MTDLTAENESALEKAEDLQRESTRKMAAEMAPSALRRIEKIGKGHLMPTAKGEEKVRPSPHSQLRANEAILAQAHGRPETRDRTGAQVEAGLVIIVNELSTGRQRVVSGETSIDRMKRVATDAVGIAADIQDRADEHSPQD